MIIFINGNMNAGKTTVAEILKKQIEKPAIVEIDELGSFISWMPIEEMVPINWENALLVIKNLVKYSFNVIVPYPISQKNFELITNDLKDVGTDVFFVNLNPPLGALVTNRGDRPLSREEIDRINVLHENKIAEHEFGIIIDNSKQTPGETTSEILEYIGKTTQSN